nr:MAG TPA: Maltodextrin-binding protein,Interferon regulatory factor 3 E6 protein, E6AP, LxxLL [Caudoviricetes sp.]
MKNCSRGFGIFIREFNFPCKFCKNFLYTRGWKSGTTVNGRNPPNPRPGLGKRNQLRSLFRSNKNHSKDLKLKLSTRIQ